MSKAICNSKQNWSQTAYIVVIRADTMMLAKTLESNADDWILLLQIDSDESIDLMWGDVGSIYYWIRHEDLARQRFDSVWMALQCS